MGLGVSTLLTGPLLLIGLAEGGRQVVGSKAEAVADSLVEVWVFSGVQLMKGSLSWMTEAIESIEAIRWTEVEVLTPNLMG